MDVETTGRIEHVCLESKLELKAFGEKFVIALALPPMEYDFENETEWLAVEVDGIEYNVSRPYEEDILQQWDETTPAGCNFGIALSFHKNHPHATDDGWVEEMVSVFCKQLAEIFNTAVYHHRTMALITGKSELKNSLFTP